MKQKEKTSGAAEKGRSITEKDLVKLEGMLLRRRGELLKETVELGKEWEKMSEPQIEVEEFAQEEEITDPYPFLDEIERKELDEIDLALNKIDAGSYGICEVCGKPISLKRLQAIPWTRFCLADAETREKPPSAVTPAVKPQL
jgi:RNA polymerase-binding transcription factor